MIGSAGNQGGPEKEALHAQIYCSRRHGRGRGDGNGPLVAVERGGDERQGCPFKRRDIAPRDHVQLEESSRRACRKPDVTGAVPAALISPPDRRQEASGCACSPAVSSYSPRRFKIVDGRGQARSPELRRRKAYGRSAAVTMPRSEGERREVKKVVLAYSGGLDTSIILKWLQTTYRCEVVTFTADLGQGEELEPARKKALLLGIKPENIFVEDLREEFVRDYVFPMFRANALYEGQYLLGTSIARPLIAKRQIDIAEKVGADAVAHGATGKGNDQVRFELSYYALKPDVTVIAPWREWDFKSREALIAFAEKNQIPIAKDKRGEAPFSTDANLLHTSSEGKVLEDPAGEVPGYVYSRTADPENAPDRPAYITIDFDRGDPVAVDGKKLKPAELLATLNAHGRAHGIGRLDLVENRFVGMKSRGMYETPGGTILL